MSGRMEGGRTQAEVVADLRAAGDTTMADMVAAMEIVPGAGIDFAALGRTLLLTLAVYLLGSLVMFVASRILNSVVQRVMYRLREDVESKIHALPLSHFDRMKRGDVLSRLTNNLDNLNQVLSESLGQIVMSLLTVVGVLGMMFALSWQLTLVTLITVPLTALVIGLLGIRSQRQFQAQWKATGVLNSRVEESITGHDLITVYGRDRVTKERFDAENDDVYRASFSAQMLSGLMMPAMQFIGNLVYVGIAVVGALQVASGQLRLGTVQAFIQYSRQFSQPLAQLGGMAAQLQSAAACAERVFELLGYPEETPDTGEVQAGHGLKLGYFAQEHDTLDQDASVLDNMRHAAPQLGDTQARTLLGSFLFQGDDVDKPARVLSGGEKTRLALATLVASSANVLLLDEPTNNLDPASREEILNALHQYEGAVVLVTHDEGAVEALDPERVVLLPDGVEDLWNDDYRDLITLA